MTNRQRWGLGIMILAIWASMPAQENALAFIGLAAGIAIGFIMLLSGSGR